MLRPTIQPVLRVSRLRSRPKNVCHFYSQRQPAAANIRHELDLNKIAERRRDYESNRKAFFGAGALAGVIAMIYTGYKLSQSLQRDSKKTDPSVIQLDSSIPTETFKTEAGEKRKIVLHDDEGREIVPSGNSTVPTLPRLLLVNLPFGEASVADSEGTEYTLVGLGTRTVTFLGIQVYVVGFYVATQDIARLQTYLVKKVNPLATTLIPSEKDSLRASLQDPTEGEETWDAILRHSGCRSLFRITPVRDTDFHHLRDGFVRAVTGRSQRDKAAYGDEAFGEAVKKFKVIFNRGQVPKKKEMLLVRDQKGALAVTYGEGDDKDPKRSVLGRVEDERLSRLLWLNYLAGKAVASEGARKNIIEGLMEFVERPVGTVATQVL